MTYLWTALGSTLWVRRRRLALALAALLVAGCAICRLTRPPEAPAALVQVGVALPREGGEAFWQGLAARESPLVQFIPADADTIADHVAASRWDCGLVLAEDFSPRLAAGEFDGLVCLVTGPGSTVYPLVRETAAAVLMELASPVLAAAYLEKSGIGVADMQWEMVTRRVEIAMVTLDGEPLTMPLLAERSGSRLLRGCVAAVVLVWTLFTAMDLGRWMETPWYRRVRLCRCAESLLLPRLLASLLPALVGGGLVLLTAGELGGALALPLYLAALGSWTLLLAELRPIRALLPVLIPLAAACALILSPVVLDVGRLFPVLLPLTEHLPVTLYLLAGEGSAAAVGGLAVTAAAGAAGIGWIRYLGKL